MDNDAVSTVDFLMSGLQKMGDAEPYSR